MDLENKALTAESGVTVAINNKIGATLTRASNFDDKENFSPNESPVESDLFNRGSMKRPLTSNVMATKGRKRVLEEDENSVVIYNVPPKTGCATLEKFLERMFLEMHGENIKIVQCRYMGSAIKADCCTFRVAFETTDLADLAVSLNGITFLNHKIYVSTYDPNFRFEKSKKSRLCFFHCVGDCKRGGRNCRGAHGVLDLKLYHETVLHESRTIYLTNIQLHYSPSNLLNMVTKKFNGHGLSPFFTAFHVRGGKGDALVEFADIRHAKKAWEVLNGAWVNKFQLEVHPWKSHWQASFVRYYEDEARARTSERGAARPDSFAALEAEYGTCKRLLHEAQGDVRYYRDHFEREKSLAKSLQSELHSTSFKYEESRQRAYHLQHDLDKTTKENEELVRESKRLKTKVENLESSGNVLDRKAGQVSQLKDELQQQLDEALSKIDTLNGTLTATQVQLKTLKSEKDSMNATIANLQEENETLVEEMEQMKMNHAMELGFAGEDEA